MLDNFKIETAYFKNGVFLDSEEFENEDFSINYTYKDSRLKLSLIPKVKIELVEVTLVYNYKYEDNSKVFVNGYQSWTYSREYTKNEKQVGLKSIAKYPPIKNIAYISGDYHFTNYSNKPGKFHSHTYGYIKNASEIEFVGSLTEKEGFSLVCYDFDNNLLLISKEVEGLFIDSPVELFDIYYFKGDYDKAFDNYFKVMEVKKPRVNHLAGYTSWYNYFGKIDEKTIIRDLEGLTRVKEIADIFQVDDGYQTAVGDWLSIKTDKFPNGMKYISDTIHLKNFLAGLWLAPFSCQKNSNIAREHPEWLLKDKKGKPILAVVAWGGAYTLDFYIPEVRTYLKKVFNEVLNVWGFDMVKLDFLYSVCMFPRNNKTRGKIMTEAMEFLRECVGDKLILGCGVPLGPAFGNVDFCRIGADVHLAYKDPFYVKLLNQEIISTKTAITNAIFRRHLNNRVFVNDPDVFLLRENKCELEGAKIKPLKFNLEQKMLLSKINNLFGDILFVSDNIGAYNEEQLDILRDTYKKKDCKVLSADIIDKENIAIIYINNDIKYNFSFNIETGEHSERKI